ncbi:MAG TPA: histidinol-phosphatase [Candidatus Ventrimonas merdavium]|nr:histidinol-phosphatase [Candidatus Ventrimonas merdavium]
MRITGDFHTHTTYCDGKSTARQMVEAAYRMGMTDFGISSHADFSYYEPGFGMSDEKLAQYQAELEGLREEYAGKLNLYIGIELDCLGPVQKAEYAIGSTHCVEKNGVYVCVDESEELLAGWVERLWGGDWYAFARDYFELEATVWDRTHCDFVGHFDLLTKFNEGYRNFDETRDEYLEPALAAMKRLNDACLPFEINTGAMSRGARTAPYPNPILLRELCAMGGRIMINSDSHRADTIGWAFDQAAKLAWDCGFRRLTLLAPGGGFREVELG